MKTPVGESNAIEFCAGFSFGSLKIFVVIKRSVLLTFTIAYGIISLLMVPNRLFQILDLWARNSSQMAERGFLASVEPKYFYNNSQRPASSGNGVL